MNVTSVWRDFGGTLLALRSTDSLTLVIVYAGRPETEIRIASIPAGLTKRAAWIRADQYATKAGRATSTKGDSADSYGEFVFVR